MPETLIYPKSLGVRPQHKSASTRTYAEHGDSLRSIVQRYGLPSLSPGTGNSYQSFSLVPSSVNYQFIMRTMPKNGSSCERFAQDRSSPRG